MIELLDKLNNSEKKELSDREKIQKISAIIHHAETKLRNKFPILNKQNLLVLHHKFALYFQRILKYNFLLSHKIHIY